LVTATIQDLRTGAVLATTTVTGTADAGGYLRLSIPVNQTFT